MCIKPVRQSEEPIYVFMTIYATGIKLWHEDLEYLKRSVQYMYEISQDPDNPPFKITLPRKGCCGSVTKSTKNIRETLGYIEKVERAV